MLDKSSATVRGKGLPLPGLESAVSDRLKSPKVLPESQACLCTCRMTICKHGEKMPPCLYALGGYDNGEICSGRRPRG